MGVGILLGASCLTGYAVTIGGWTPGNLLGVPLASEVYSIHATLAAIALSVALLIARKSELSVPSSRDGRVAAAMVSAAVLFMAVTVVLRRATVDVVGPFVGALQTVAGALVVSGAVRRLRARGAAPGAFGLCLAGVVGVVVGARMIFMHDSLARTAFEVLAITSVAALGEPEHDSSRSRFAFAALVGMVELRASIAEFSSNGTAFIATLTAASWLLLGGTLIARAFRNAPTIIGQPHAAATARLALSLAAPSIVLRSFLASLPRDIHLHDTTFIVGAMHMEVFVVLLGWLAFWLRDREPRPRARGALHAGVGLVGLGAHLTCWGMVVLGTRGMPMRYRQYLDRFQPHHQVISLAATMLIVGLLLMITSTRTRSERTVNVSDVFA